MVQLAAALAERGHDIRVTARPESFVLREAERRGLPVTAATCRRQQDWSDAGIYRKLLREFRPDIVHVHTSYDYFVPPILAQLAGTRGVIMSRHVPYGIRSGLSRRLYGRIFFDRIIALSGSVRRTLLECEIPDQRIATIHHGTDTDAFRAQATTAPEALRAEWQIPGDAFVAGIAGRLIPEKGVGTLLDALTAALANGTDVCGVIIGDGPLEHELRERAATPPLQDHVRFVGFRSDIASAIGALDTLVLASTWAEPCAAVIQQAMALGKPVIGTDIGGTPEMIDQQKTGLLVPPADPDALAKAITTLASDPEKRRKMGDAGRERADELFTLSRMVDRVEALYYDILRAKRVL